MRGALARVRRHGLEAMIALAALMSAVVFLLSPTYRQLSAVGRELPHGVYLWTWLYAIGGALTLAGIVLRWVQVRVLGLAALGGAFMVQAYATATVPSPIPFVARITTISVLLALAAGALLTIYGVVWHDD